MEYKLDNIVGHEVEFIYPTADLKITAILHEVTDKGMLFEILSVVNNSQGILGSPYISYKAGDIIFKKEQNFRINKETKRNIKIESLT